MKTLTIAIIILLLAGAAWAQDATCTAKSGSCTSASPKTLTVSGKVSKDGKTLLTDIDSEWVVTNAEALKGYEGRMVTVKCYVDSDNSRIQIVSVKRGNSSPAYAVKYGDSAFRR